MEGATKWTISDRVSLCVRYGEGGAREQDRKKKSKKEETEKRKRQRKTVVVLPQSACV